MLKKLFAGLTVGLLSLTTIGTGRIGTAFAAGTTSVVVTSVSELTEALGSGDVSDITINGPIGTGYTVFEVNNPVKITGGSGAQIFGTFVVKADDVTIQGLAIENKGDLGGDQTPPIQNRGNIIVYAKNIVLRDNTLTHGLGNLDGLANAIQIFSNEENTPLSNYIIEGNNINGFNNEARGSSSAAILIAQGYSSAVIGGQSAKTIIATEDDYAKLLDNNTFTNNVINVTHQDWSKSAPVLHSAVCVNDEAGLVNAVANSNISTIILCGVIGSDSDYTVYNVNRSVTIQGSEGAQVFGTFVVKADDVTIQDLAIENKGDLTGESSNNRGGIYVFANHVNIANNTFTNGLGTNAGLSNAIQVMSPTSGNLLSNYIIKGNTFKGHDNEVTNWSSSAIVITQGFSPASAGADIQTIEATEADYTNLLNNNTFTNNAINVTHQDWLDGLEILYSAVCVNDEAGLVNAVANSNISTIILCADIITTEKINITRDNVTIDGSGYSLSRNGDNSNGWDNSVILQAYTSTGIVVKNLTFNGADISFIVNGSEVIAENITINNPEFGGIEIAQGTDVTETPKLYLKGSFNYNNSLAVPAVWLHEKVNNDDGWFVNETAIEFNSFKNPAAGKTEYWYVVKPTPPVVSGNSGGGGYSAPIVTPDTEVILSGSIETGCSIENSRYSNEQNKAYQYACANDITTMESVQEARVNDHLTRAEFGKMMSNYAQNILKREPNAKKLCKFNDADEVNAELAGYMVTACQYNIMGIDMEDNMFLPNQYISRAEVVTILSRLFDLASDGTPYYINHMAAMKVKGFITVNDPNMLELRGNVFIMLERIANVMLDETE